MASTTYECTNGVWHGWNISTNADATTWAYWNMDTSYQYNATKVWYSWNNGTGDVTYDNSNDNTVWVEWNYIIPYHEQTVSTPAPLKKDKNEYRRNIRRQIRARKRQLKQDRKYKVKEAMRLRALEEAELKAQELLFDVLGEKQAEVFRRTGRLLVKGEKFDWLIKKSGEGHRAWASVKRVKKNKVIDLCVRVNVNVPPSDQILAFALASKYDEEHFDKTANSKRVNDRKELPECANF